MTGVVFENEHFGMITWTSYRDLQLSITWTIGEAKVGNFFGFKQRVELQGCSKTQAKTWYCVGGQKIFILGGLEICVFKLMYSTLVPI